VEFFESIQEGDGEAAQEALLKSVRMQKFSPAEISLVFTFLIAELNRRYNYTLSVPQVINMTLSNLASDPLGSRYACTRVLSKLKNCCNFQ
jgi:hypothetical protein